MLCGLPVAKLHSPLAQTLVLLSASYMIIIVYVFTKTAEHKYSPSIDVLFVLLGHNLK